MVQAPPFPAPSLRELARPKGVTEGVSSDGSSGPVVTRNPLLALKFLSGYVHRSTLPQSRFARQLPQGGSREGRAPVIVPPGNRKVAGDFHRPYATQKPVPFTIHRSTLPQSRIRSTAPSEREPGGLCHSSYRPETARLRAIFIAPTKLKRFWFSPFIGALARKLTFCHSKMVLTKWSIGDRLSIEVDRL